MQDLHFIYLSKIRKSACFRTGNIDIKTTMKQRKSARRKQLEGQTTATSEFKFTETQAGELQIEIHSSTESDEFGESDPHDHDYVPLPSSTFKTRGGSSQMTIFLLKIAKTADRFKVSHRAAALISNSVLENFGIIRQDNT